MSSILIKNIQLIDGTSKPAYKSDVLVKGDKISAIGRFANYHAEEVIDGMNAYLAPGFIDISNSSDKYLNIFDNRQQESLMNQGITTIIGGHNGLSLAPLFYGALNVLKPYSSGKKINIDWHEFSEFADVFSRRKTSLNFGSFIGCGTIYHDIINPVTHPNGRYGVKEKTPRNLATNEEKILYHAIEKGFTQGAFGSSFNLDDDNSVISYYELKKIAAIAKKTNKICSIGFEKNGGAIAEKVKKIIHLGKETLSHFIINEFTPITGHKEEFEQSLQLLNENQTSCDAYFTLSPCRDIVKQIKNYLPEDILKDNISGIEILKTKRKEIIKHLSKIIKTGRITIISANSNPHLTGRTLREFSHHRNLSLVEGFFELMKITKLRAEVSSPDADEEKIIQAIQNEKALVATCNNASFSCKPFKKFLEMAKKINMPLEKAINKITFFPAQLLGIKNRGALQTGYFADLIIFKDNEIKEMLINGQRIIKDEKFQQGLLAGKFLKS